jgi:hypothetical protein
MLALGFPRARSGQRRPYLDRPLIMPRTARRPRLRSQPLPHRRTRAGRNREQPSRLTHNAPADPGQPLMFGVRSRVPS